MELYSGSIKGKVIDKETDEPIVGATVKVLDTKYGATTDKKGRYVIKNVPIGKYKLVATMIGYKAKEEEVTIKKDDEVDSENFKLKPEAFMANELTVSAKSDKEEESSSRLDEKRNINVSNIVSASAIQISPDITVANVVQRISGISIQRNDNGDGQYAIVRGMDKRYNYTLVNGIKIPSPNDRQRYVPLDIFPSDLLARLEVYKSLTPDMEGDAIGGAVNLQMKEAPEVFTLKTNASVGYSDIFLDYKFDDFNRDLQSLESPQQKNGRDYYTTMKDMPMEVSLLRPGSADPHYLIGMSLGGRLQENKFGYLFAGSVQNMTLGSHSIFFEPQIEATSNRPALNSVADRFFSSRQQRTGLHAKLDYKFEDNQKLDFFASYIDLYEAQVRRFTDTSLWRPNRKVGEGTISDERRTRQILQNIIAAGLKGTHDLMPSLISMDWTFSYAIASRNEPDMSSLDLTYEAKRDTFGNYINPSVRYDNYSRRWTNNNDQDITGFLNFYIKIDNDLDFKFGGMQRRKTRENFYDEYRLRPDPPTQEFNENTFVDTTKFYVFNNNGSSRNSMNFDIKENVTAGYLMGKYRWENLLITGGTRIEKTEMNFTTKEVRALEVDGGLSQEEADSIDIAKGVIGSRLYTDVLPSINFKYMPNDKTNWRASYYRSISRPGFFEVIPYNLNEEEYNEVGNPRLNRVSADNLDLRFEYFPTNRDQVLAGIFYKNIIDPIERALTVRGTSIFLTTLNFDRATNYGFEFDFIRYENISKMFGGEDDWGDLGLKLNYTFTSSNITTDKIERFRVDSTNINLVDPKLIADGTIKIGDITQRNVEQLRPLQGQSANIANITLMYKHTKENIDAQIGLAYTGERINSVSPFINTDEWEAATWLMDMSFEKKFDFGLGIFLKIRNLLDTPREVYLKQPLGEIKGNPPFQDDPNRILVRSDIFRRTYQLGVRYNF